uniref:Uncharacterized protein n=1 Tax=viral metagenome TaxID=1070528 RepID=A0A6H1Z7W3_9ZZZZ
MTPIIETCAKCGARLSIEDHECDQCRECGRDLGQRNNARVPPCDRCGASVGASAIHGGGSAIWLCATCGQLFGANPPENPDSSPRLDTLSKSDFERLGCEDVSSPQLRARVFLLEGLASELALTLKEMMSDLDGLDFVRPIVMIRAQEVLESARERLA